MFSQIQNTQQKNHFKVIDSLTTYKGAEAAITYIDKIISTDSLNKEDVIGLNIYRGQAYGWMETQDSMSFAILSKYQNAFLAVGDTSKTNYADILTGLGQLKSNEAQYNQAISLFNKANKIYQQDLESNNIKFIDNQFSKATTFQILGDYEKAEAIYKEVINARKITYGINHPSYAQSLHYLGLLYNYKAEYKRAEPLILEALEIRKNTFGKTHTQYSQSLANLGYLYNRLGMYDKVESIYLECREIEEKNRGTSHPSYGATVNNLGAFYHKIGDYDQAEKYHREVLEIRKRVLGIEHPKYAESLKNLGNTLMVIGNYNESEKLLLKAKEILFEVYDTEHQQSAHCLNDLGTLYSKLGQYEKAEQAFTAALNIREKVLGKEHPLYGRSLFNLAGAYKAKSDYEKAKSLYKDAFETTQKSLGEKHYFNAVCLKGLSTINAQLNKHEEARSQLTQAQSILEIALGTEHFYNAILLDDLGTINTELKNYDKAEEQFLKAIKIRRNIFGEDNLIGASCAANLSILHKQKNNLKKAAEYALIHNKLQINSLKTSFDFLSEIEKLRFHQRIIGSFDLLKSIGKNFSSPEYNNAIFNTLLVEKGIHLQSTIQTKKYIFAQEDNSTNNLYDQLNLTRIEHIKQLEKPKDKRIRVDSLQTQIEVFEKQLATISTSFRKALRTNNIDISDIQSKIKSNEIVIEFTHYKPNKDSDSTLYAACILTSENHPQYVSLFEEKELASRLEMLSKGTNNINELYGVAMRGLVTRVKSQRSLYEMIWEPLEPILNNKKLIYYSLSGLLHRLNLQAISIDEETVLADQYQMINLMSSRTIAAPAEIITNNSAYIIGGVDYNTPIPDIDEIAINPEPKNDLAFHNSDPILRSVPWQYLKWTEKETNEINNILGESGYTLTYKTQQDATEEDFKKLGTNTKSPQIIHLATHGYFFPDPQITKDGTGENIFKLSEHPLMRSGLILTGANDAWLSKANTHSHEDGILTAFEISNMNLSNTELIVLSACETALGDIIGNEGVFGLQRAFKMAGAKYLIMSLWQVPDRATSVFMSSFYNNWLKNKLSIREAFNTTQLQMRDRFFDPYNWAGFTLIE